MGGEHHEGDLWAGTVLRVAKVITREGGTDLLVVDARTGVGRFDERGDLVYPEHLASIGHMRVASIAERDALRAEADRLRAVVEAAQGLRDKGLDDEALDALDALDAGPQSGEDSRG